MTHTDSPILDSTADSATDARKYLGVYLNDHLAGATGALDLIARTASENEGSELGEFLTRLHGEIEQDRDVLEEVMVAFNVDKNPVKQTVAWIGEKLARLKPNGEILSYSPYSRLLELEALSAGIEGKRLLWRSLRTLTRRDGRLTAERLDELIGRAERQRDEVERFRLAAAEAAFVI